MIIEDNLIKKWDGRKSSVWQQEKWGIGGNKNVLARKAGGFEVQRGCVINIVIKMQKKKMNSTWNECNKGYIDMTLWWSLGLPDCLEGTHNWSWNIDNCSPRKEMRLIRQYCKKTK